MNSLLVGVPECHLKKLARVQHAAARLIVKAGKRDHITPILESLHWLPIPFRIEYKILLLTYKALHDKAPQYIADLLVPYTTTRTLRSSSKQLLAVPKIKTATYGERQFSYAAPKAWNLLPEDLKSISALSQFKSSLKTYLFRKCFN